MKNLFGKRGIALLTTLALVISMVAMLGGLTASAEYTPKRTMSITAGGTQIEGKILMYKTAEILGAEKDVVIKGYYKVDDYVAKNTTDHNVQIAPNAATGSQSAKADCGWTPFEATWNTGKVGDYHVMKFGFWYAQGTMSLADIVIEDTEGNVLYDFATDKDLPAGDIAGGEQYGFWYFGFYGEKSEFSGHIDEAVEPFVPSRTMSITAGGTQIEGKILMYKTAEILGAEKDVVIKGYYKVDDYVAKNTTDHNVQIAPNAATGSQSAKADCGWTPFEATWNTGKVGDYHVMKFGFWYAQGTMSLADIVIEDTEGNVLYDFATDKDLPAGDIAGGEQYGFWYFGYYGEKSEFSGHIDEAVDTGYKPTRVISIDVKNNDINSKFTITGSGTKIGEGKTVTVKGYYKLENFAVVDESKGPKVNIASGLVNITADTDGWVYFEKPGYVCGDASSNWLSFSFWYATGKLSLADIVFVDENDKVVYDLISDEGLVEGDYNSTPLTQSMWYMSHYSANGNVTVHIDASIPAEDPCANGHTYIGGICKFCEAEKEYATIEGDPNYVPDRVMSIETFGGKNGAAGTAIEGKFLLTRGYFPGHSVVFIKGYYKIENYREAVTGSDYNVQIGAGGGCNPDDSFAAKGNTNGWVAFSIGFIPKAQDNTDWEGLAKFGHWYTHGKLSLADVTVESRDGEVLYDMRYDESLPTGTTVGGTEFLTEEEKGLQTDRWYIGAYGYDDWSDIEVVVTEALEKPVDPPAQTGDADIFFVVALGTMAAITLAVVTLNKKKFSV